MTLITGLIGLAILLAFEGVMLWWIKAPALIVIVTVVIAMILYDFVQTVREERS
jgi:hypothetical protein